MRAWFLSDPEQECTAAILHELGACVAPAKEALATTGMEAAVEETMELSEEHLGAVFAETVKELGREHCLQDSNGQEYFCLSDGRVYIDVRDSADVWIRIALSKKIALVLPNGMWRRLVLPSEDPFVVLERRTKSSSSSSSSSNSNGKESHFVKTYRFSSREDEQRLASLRKAEERREGGGMQQLIVDLCRQFYELGWVTGTGGSISIRHGNRVYMTPSGVQKERILPEELYVLDMSGNELYAPPESKPGRARLKLTACAPLFFHSYRIRNAGAVIHSHGMDCVLATLLQGEHATEFRMTHQEMIKGIAGHGYLSTLVIPIIENTPHEADLADSLGEAISKYPEATAVLVRRHGIYIWGSTWMQAKTQAECYHYLFRLAVEMHRLGLDYTTPPALCGGGGGGSVPILPISSQESFVSREKEAKEAIAGIGCCGGGGGGGGVEGGKTMNSHHHHCQGRQVKEGGRAGGGRAIKHILMDIEGTTTSISFVHDTLFPYAKSAVGAHVREKLRQNDPEILLDLAALRAQAVVDSQGEGGEEEEVPLIPEVDGAVEVAAEELVEAVVRNVEWQMGKDRKTTALKQLQGHIWRAGYEKGEIRSHVYDDVPEALRRWSRGKEGREGGRAGLKLAVYSSGSREAQRLLLGYTTVGGDLREYLNCYFDTTVGGKREERSYREIGLSLGVEKMEEILFLTDVVEEGVAARKAGMKVLLSVRPGNAPIDETLGEGFARVSSFSEVDDYLEGIHEFPSW